MERNIYVAPLQKRFTVAVKDANKAARNRSFSNASDCCGVKLKQEKRCSSCNAEVASAQCRRKIVRIGRQEYLLDAAVLDKVLEDLEQFEDVQVTGFLDKEPDGAKDRYEGLIYATPADKKAAQYKELCELLKGKVGVGKAVFRNNEFQVLVEVGGDGVLRIRKLVDEAQRYDFNPQEVAAMVSAVDINPQLIDLERKVVEKATVNDYDVTKFRDTRAETEEKIIEELATTGKVTSVTPKSVVAQEEDEIERLQKLLGAK